jgi:hypothetical protein
MVPKKSDSVTGHPTPSRTLNRWFADTQLVEDIKQFLASRAFQIAVAVLKDATKPSFRNISFKSSEENNIRIAWYAGYCDAFADLEKLGTAPTKKGQSEPEEWNHIDTGYTSGYKL